MYFFDKHVTFWHNCNLFGNILSRTTSFCWEWRKKYVKKTLILPHYLIIDVLDRMLN